MPVAAGAQLSQGQLAVGPSLLVPYTGGVSRCTPPKPPALSSFSTCIPAAHTLASPLSAHDLLFLSLSPSTLLETLLCVQDGSEAGCWGREQGRAHEAGFGRKPVRCVGTGQAPLAPWMPSASHALSTCILAEASHAVPVLDESWCFQCGVATDRPRVRDRSLSSRRWRPV